MIQPRIGPAFGFLLVVLASWPWLAGLGFWPMATDTGLWIERGDPAGADWRRWVFQTSHFGVGFRPLTALSFSATSAWLPLSPLSIRGVDVLIHLAAAAGVACLAGSLTRDRLVAWIALLIFLVHPAVEDVVPISARRSYSLALGLAAWGLVSAARGARTGRDLPRAAGALLCAPLLAAALLANEVAAPAIVVLPLICGIAEAGRAGAFRRTVLCALPSAGLVGAALYWRQTVVGGLGGYRVGGDPSERARQILEACGEALLRGADPLHWILAGTLGLGLVAAAMALRRAGRPGALAALTWMLWLMSYPLLYASQGVWYPRQAYAALLPLVLALAWLVHAARSGRGPGRALAGLAAALLVAFVLHDSPALTGRDARRLEKWGLRQGLIEALAECRALEGPALVHTVLPYRSPDPGSADLRARASKARLPRDARQPFHWAQYLLRDSPIELAEFLYVEEADWTWRQRTELLLEPPGPAVRVPSEREVLRVRFGAARRRAPQALPIEVVPPDTERFGRAVYVFQYTARGGRLDALPD